MSEGFRTPEEPIVGETGTTVGERSVVRTAGSASAGGTSAVRSAGISMSGTAAFVSPPTGSVASGRGAIETSFSASGASLRGFTSSTDWMTTGSGYVGAVVTRMGPFFALDCATGATWVMTIGRM